MLRLVDVCARPHRDPEALLEGILDTLRAWTRDREQGDDITLLALNTGDQF
jgi:serine phosphatase RsbU (regulator of sigma subunit)